MIKSKDPQLHSKVAAMSKYYAQYTQDFHVSDGCLWMDERLVIPNTLQAAVNNRLHYITITTGNEVCMTRPKTSGTRTCSVA